MCLEVRVQDSRSRRLMGQRDGLSSNSSLVPRFGILKGKKVTFSCARLTITHDAGAGASASRVYFGFFPDSENKITTGKSLKQYISRLPLTAHSSNDLDTTEVGTYVVQCETKSSLVYQCV